VALSLVTDPLGRYDASELRTTFPDLCRPYKDHFVIDFGARGGVEPSAQHRRNVRRAQLEVEVERSADPIEHAEQWVALYDNLISRHRIRGISAFSRSSLIRQLRVPGLTMFRGIHGGATVGITLWYTQGDAAYYHLGAYSEAGYASRASFALFQYAIDHFAGQVACLNLGAGAGAWGDGKDGLTRFKKGWANGVRRAWLCGRVFDRERYRALVAAHGVGDTSYFPAYREGEFS
jgi:hypothetical protein